MSDQLAEIANQGLGVCDQIWGTLPPTPKNVIRAIEEFEAPLIGREPIEVPTEHVIAAGMYARTIVVPAGYIFTGALVKRATILIAVGWFQMLAGEELIELKGYNVIPASAGRKQVFKTLSPLILTMLFPTQAQTVVEAEAEATDQAEDLLSRRQDANKVVTINEKELECLA
ncbi:MAG: hypothetical protein WB424_02405 [Terracidiphilus sp.]